jgi:hypothetical protein
MRGNGDYASGSTMTSIVSADFTGDGTLDPAASNAGATSTGA